MDRETANYNASVIYDSPNSIFVADENGKLDTISRFNLLGRIIEWVKDLRSDGERSKGADKAVTETLEKIHENVKAGSFYIQDNNRLSSPIWLISFFHGPLPVHIYQFNHPLDEFSDKVINSSLGSKPEIGQIAQQIKEIALPLINALSEDEKNDLFKTPQNV